MIPSVHIRCFIKLDKPAPKWAHSLNRQYENNWKREARESTMHLHARYHYLFVSLSNLLLNSLMWSLLDISFFYNACSEEGDMDGFPNSTLLSMELHGFLSFIYPYILQGTPIQGSKLRLPGYLSGKGFHSGEDSGLISTAATRVRAHFAGECWDLKSGRPLGRNCPGDLYLQSCARLLRSKVH